MGKAAVNIIGAGVSGLAAAIRLAAKGHPVTVFEQSACAGGKIGQLEWNGFRWERGPVSFMIPELLEELFMIGGMEMKQMSPYRRLDPVSRLFFESGRVLNLAPDAGQFVDEQAVELMENPAVLHGHLDRSSRLFSAINKLFLQNDWLRKGALQSRHLQAILMRGWKMDASLSMHERNLKQFNSMELVQWFDWLATASGSDPYRAPATLNMWSHIFHRTGPCYPEQGMDALAKAMKQLADHMGVVFHFNQPVECVSVDRGGVKGVVTPAGIFPSPVVVSAMDAFYLYRDLLEDAHLPLKYFKRERSHSAIVFSWAMDCCFDHLSAHNTFFSARPEEEFTHLKQKHRPYADPTIELFISSKITAAHAPDGQENWRVLVHVPENLGQDWDKIIEECRQHVIDKLGRLLSCDPGTHIVHEFIDDPRSIEEATLTHRGALYGNSSNSLMGMLSRHPNHLPRYRGLYFAGGSVQPGGGIPMSVLSARKVSQHISHFRKKTGAS